MSQNFNYSSGNLNNGIWMSSVTSSVSLKKIYKKLSEFNKQMQTTVSYIDSKIDSVFEKDEKEVMESYRATLAKIEHILNEYKRKTEDVETLERKEEIIAILKNDVEKYKQKYGELLGNFKKMKGM